ncbi:DUF1499 domain-containing protein [Abyssibacter profundi]|uniref:DUF1499 domain-containing protein n=1 Tax=Abyssibacter profundi TaxID=2182787 RepID=UPI001A9C8CAA|nr:DUF1499 domain-containing protein [Abyssibacter profundi]
MSKLDDLMAGQRWLPVGALALLGALGLGGCAAIGEHRVGLTAEGRLQPCPPAPRCVSSQAQVQQRSVRPLVLRTDRPDVWSAVRDTVSAQPRTVIVDSRRDYLRAEVSSPWGVYTDDLELLRQSDRIDLRSTARLGYYDFGVNRERVNALRQALIRRGLVEVSNPGEPAVRPSD